MSALPVEGIYLLQGNDLAGDKIVINPLVTDKPSLDQKVGPIEKEFPDLFPAYAVTKAMANNALENDVHKESIPLADTSIGQAFDEVTFTLSSDQSKGIKYSDPLLTTHFLYSNQVDKRQSLVVEQGKDPEICLFQRAIIETESIQFGRISIDLSAAVYFHSYGLAPPRAFTITSAESQFSSKEPCGNQRNPNKVTNPPICEQEALAALDAIACLCSPVAVLHKYTAGRQLVGGNYNCCN